MFIYIYSYICLYIYRQDYGASIWITNHRFDSYGHFHPSHPRSWLPPKTPNPTPQAIHVARILLAQRGLSPKFEAKMSVSYTYTYIVCTRDRCV